MFLLNHTTNKLISKGLDERIHVWGWSGQVVEAVNTKRLFVIVIKWYLSNKVALGILCLRYGFGT